MTRGRRGESPAICCQRNNKYLRIYRRNCGISWKEAEAEAIRQQSQYATINSSTTPSAIDGANKTTPTANASESPNFIAGIATRTRDASHAVFNSTTPVFNETLIPNDVTGSDQHTAPQAAQPVAPQVNDDGSGGDDNNNVLPQNMDANEFENVSNCDDFDLNTKILHEILFHIANGNPLPADFVI